MKAQSRVVTVGLSFLLALAWPAAAVAEIDFDALPAGTVVATQFPAATFSCAAGQEIRVVEYSVPESSAPNAICTATAGGAFTCTAPFAVDFANPVSGLSFRVLGDNLAGVHSSVVVYVNGVAQLPLPIDQDGAESTAELVDLSAFADVTRIEISANTDLGGLAYDDFQGDGVPVELQSFSVE